jgi:Alternative complex III, ActD subunit
MSAEVELVGAFTEEERLLHCIGELQAAKTRFRVFSPIPSEHINKALYKKSSFVRWFVLLGGITGLITAFVLTIGTSLEWNLIAGGKPIASIAPYCIIGFELMVLFGGISAVSSWILLANLPTFEPLSGYRSRFASDEFGLVVRCPEDDASRFESMLRDAGAQEITREAA